MAQLLAEGRSSPASKPKKQPLDSAKSVVRGRTAPSAPKAGGRGSQVMGKLINTCHMRRRTSLLMSWMTV